MLDEVRLARIPLTMGFWPGGTDAVLGGGWVVIPGGGDSGLVWLTMLR